MSGYHGQARVENAFFRYTSVIGDGLRACSPAGRGTEVVLALQHSESNDWAGQANVVPHRSVTGAGRGAAVPTAYGATKRPRRV